MTALHLTNVDKSFGENQALKGAWFSAEFGQLHALLGENGAGKSTLMNIVCGLYLPDQGEVAIDGETVSIDGPADAKALGIGMIHQHFKLVRPFTVAENVLLANTRGGWRRGKRAISDEIRALSEKIGLPIDPNARIDAISVAEQQRVEIVKALIAGARILILDEPTAVLTDEESDRLLTTMRELARNGTCVVLITHKLREVLDHADHVTVMRGGETVASQSPEGLTPAELTELMVGVAPRDETPASQVQGAVCVEIEKVSANRADGSRALSDFSLSVRSGEIVGLAGVGGNGQTELAEVVTGLREAHEGVIFFESHDLTRAHPRQRRRSGIASVSADRYGTGLAGNLSVAENYCIGGIEEGDYGSPWWIRSGRMRQRTLEAIRSYEIAGARPGLTARLLSGGNAQKLVLARELGRKPKLLIAHSPTRGLDVRACAAIHAELRRARDAGCGILLISEDLDEILSLSDRVGVINRGRIVGEFPRPVDRQVVGHLMTGHA